MGDMLQGRRCMGDVGWETCCMGDMLHGRRCMGDVAWETCCMGDMLHGRHVAWETLHGRRVVFIAWCVFIAWQTCHCMGDVCFYSSGNHEQQDVCFMKCYTGPQRKVKIKAIHIVWPWAKECMQVLHNSVFVDGTFHITCYGYKVVNITTLDGNKQHRPLMCSFILHSEAAQWKIIWDFFAV